MFGKLLQNYEEQWKLLEEIEEATVGGERRISQTAYRRKGRTKENLGLDGRTEDGQGHLFKSCLMLV